MFDLGFMEMLVIGVVALIVVGPKDLPGLFRSVGRFMGKAKGMAREFSSAMNAAADEAGVNEINKTLKAAANPQKFGVDKIREATKMDKPEEEKPLTETDKLRAKMTDERKAQAEKINKAMADKAEARMAAEKAAADAAEAADAPAPKDAT
ncbi:MAG: Sec-independent protein translocase protein TatB [Pseudomonadota bacterium]